MDIGILCISVSKFLLSYLEDATIEIAALLNMNTMISIINIIGVILLIFSNSIRGVCAYRQGDAVGILLRTHTASKGSSTLEAYRHHLPRFGVSTKTRFDISTLLNDDDIRLGEGNKSSRQNNKRVNEISEHLRLSIAFDEGFHNIPWLDVYNPKHNDEKMLQSLIITIVYSGNDGNIHAVHRESKYQSPITNKKSFTVEYVWIEEADVDVQSALLVMFGIVFIVSIMIIVSTCTSTEYGMNGKINKRYVEMHSSLGGGDFAKSL